MRCFKIDQATNIVTRCEAGIHAVPMLPQTSAKIVRDTDVQRTGTIREDIDEECFHLTVFYNSHGVERNSHIFVPGCSGKVKELLAG